MANPYFTSFASRLGLVALLTVGGLTAQGQNLNYAASGATNVTGTYTDLGTNGTAISTANNDDANSAAQNIGFTFNYNGQAFTQFVLNTNGYLKLGSTAPAAPYFYADPQQTVGGPLNSATEANLILPFNTDLEAGSTGTEYRVYTSGTTGSRVCTIQWKNVSDKASTIAKQYANISFQVKLYEGTNQIEFVYSTATAGATATATYRTVAAGLKGSGNDAFQLVTVQKASTGAWSSAVAQNADYPYPASGFAPTGHNVRATMLPDAGRTYRFATSTACATPTPVVSTFPYTESFNGAETGRLPCGVQVLDVNTDGFTWNTFNVSATTTVDNALVYQYNPYSITTAANEWAFTPGLALRAGYRYQLQFKYAAGNATYPEGLEVKFGTAATVAGQTGLIFSNTAITNAAFTTTAAGTTTGGNQVLAITPTTTGTYYIGFHAISTANQLALLLDDIQVTESPVLAVRNATNDVFKAEASPVPFGETLNLSLNTLKAGPLQLVLGDAMGRTVSRTTTATLPVGSSSVTVPGVSNLPAGIYFLTIEQGGATQVIRVTHQ